MPYADPVFTGIVQHLGTVESVADCETGKTLLVGASGWEHRPSPGDSIAVNGCCLTVRSPRGLDEGSGRIAFDVIHQTLRMTTLGDLAAGDPVNLEPAVTPQTLMSGHLVQGHVDGVGRIAGVQADDGEHRVRIEPPAELMPLIVDKGSIAVDGISLTIADRGATWFEVALIPTTLELTTLGRVRDEGRVNLETDYVAKIVVGWLERGN